MDLTPTEEARLLVFTAAQLARETRARGVLLNVPEATALIADEMHRVARAGGGFEDVADAGRAALARTEVLDGVPELLDEIRVEVLLDEGTRLIVLRRPLG